MGERKSIPEVLIVAYLSQANLNNNIFDANIEENDANNKDTNANIKDTDSNIKDTNANIKDILMLTLRTLILRVMMLT